MKLRIKSMESRIDLQFGLGDVIMKLEEVLVCNRKPLDIIIPMCHWRFPNEVAKQ